MVFISSIIFFSVLTTFTYGYIRGCYYTNWAQYRLESNGAFLPEDIASNLCTHILYAFASATAEGTAIPTEWNDEAIRSRPGLYARVVNLKNINPKLKVLLAFDGGALGSKAFSIIVQSIEKRKNFTKSTIAFVRKHKFDGIVLHWNEMGKEYEHANFIKEIKEAFMKESQFSSNEQLVLTIAGSAQKDSIDASYQVDFLAKNIDLLFLLAYDFHNGLEQTTDLPSKLYSSQKDAVDNVAFAANYWVSKGMPKDKIVIGLSGFATGWTLADASQANIGARASGPSPPLAEGNSEGGKTAYWKICDYLNANAKETVDKEHVGAYLTEGNRWYGYDNPETIKIKVKWLKEQGFAGAFLSSLDADDFRGTSCGVGVYPLLTTIKKGLEIGGQELNSVTTANFVTTFKIESTTTIPHDIDGNKEFGRRCPISSGLFPHPFSAQKYILCLFGSLYVMTCPPNCRFNSHILACTFKYPFAAEPNNFRCLDESDFWHPAPKGSDNPWHPTPRRTDNPWYYNPRGIDNPWHPTPRRTDNPWYYNPRRIDNPWHPSPRRTDNAWYPSPRRTDNAWHPTPRRTDNTWYHDQIGTGIWYHNPRGIENPSNPIQIDNLWNTIRSRTDDSWSLIAREPDDFKNQTVTRAHTSWNSFPREPDYIPDHRYHQAGHKIKLPVSEAHRLLQS